MGNRGEEKGRQGGGGREKNGERWGMREKERDGDRQADIDITLAGL